MLVDLQDTQARAERERLDTRTVGLRAELDLLWNRIKQYEERIRRLAASRAAHEREQVLIKRDVDILRGLHARQLADEGTLIVRQREAEQTAGRIGSLAAEIATARVAIGEMRHEMLQVAHTRHTDVADRLSAAQQEWYAVRERLVAV